MIVMVDGKVYDPEDGHEVILFLYDQDKENIENMPHDYRVYAMYPAELTNTFSLRNDMGELQDYVRRKRLN